MATFGKRATVLGMAVLLAALGAAVMAGCSGRTARMDVDSEDDALGGAIGSKDFRGVCFEMAQSVVRLPQIQNASSPPTIAFFEMVNNSDELVNAEDVLYKIRTELIKNSGGKMMFLDRDAIEKIKTERRDKERGKVTSSSNKALYGADFFMSGRIEGIRRSRGRTETEYIRISVRLTDAASSAIVWENDYEFKKLLLRGVYDR
jgi:PBP1b-binding outer membrane lipoprotein LpoB